MARQANFQMRGCVGRTGIFILAHSFLCFMHRNLWPKHLYAIKL